MPLTYHRRLAAASTDLTLVRQPTADGPDLVRCWLQAAPARKLPKLAQLPVLVLTGEASYHAPYGHCTVKYPGAGRAASDVRETGRRRDPRQRSHADDRKEHHEIAAVIDRWLDTSVPRRR